MRVVLAKNERSVENIFFPVPFHGTYCLFIFTNYNPTLNCNEQYKEEIGHDNDTLWKLNHRKSEHNINQDRKY